MVERRRQGEPDLADDLEPHVQGRKGRLPLSPRELGPPNAGRPHHLRDGRHPPNAQRLGTMTIDDSRSNVQWR